jgi:ABC-type branched-subunit amino acid transport system permease subunit
VAAPGAYFAIGTLALAEVLRIVVGNLRSEVSTLPATTIAAYRLTHRYCGAAVLAAGTTVAVALLDRLGAHRGRRARRS